MMYVNTCIQMNKDIDNKNNRNNKNNSTTEICMDKTINNTPWKQRQIMLQRAGIHPNPGPNALHDVAQRTHWSDSKRLGMMTRQESIVLLERLGLSWNSTPLYWDAEKGRKRGIVQSTQQDPIASGIYIRCANSNISVIDIDADTPDTRQLLTVLNGRCNLVALTPKGLHLFFEHHSSLPRGFTGRSLGYDVRSYDDMASDIVLVAPSAYVANGERRDYKWCVVPAGKLLTCPQEVINIIPTLTRKCIHRVRGTKRTNRGSAQITTQQVTEPPAGLRVVSWNLHQGARAAITDACRLSAEGDILCFQEIGNGADTLHTLSEYYVWTTPEVHGRGTAILVRRTSVDASHHEQIATPEGTTATIVELYMNKVRLCIANVYVSPSSSRGTITNMMSTIMPRRPDIILGDMNARHVRWCPACREDANNAHPMNEPAHYRGNEVINFLAGTGWETVTPLTITPTRQSTGTRPTTPDLVLTSPSLQVEGLNVHWLPSSDHAQLSFYLPGTPACRRRAYRQQISWRKVTEHHEVRFKQELDQHIREPALALDDTVSSFTAAVRRAEKRLPRGVLRRCVPGWSAKLTTLAYEITRLSNNAPEAAALTQQYNALAVEEFDQWHKHNETSLWDETRRKATPPAKIIINSHETITTRKERCTYFAAHFANKHDNNIVASPYVPKNVELHAAVTVDEVEAAILAHPLRKSRDRDGLAAEHLRLLTAKGLIALADIFTISLRTGEVPKSWRHSRIRPVLKPNKPPNKLSSYRPVAITSILCRTLERVIFGRIEGHIQQYCHQQQFGFRRAFSCEQLLRTLVDNITPREKQQEATLVTAFDFTDAFCTVHKDIVAERLAQDVGVPAVYARWVHAFLCGRSISVYEDDYNSLPVPVRHGVPQGSVLGPILWNIFVQPLFKRLDRALNILSIDKRFLRGGSYGYADDLTTSITFLKTPWLTPKHIRDAGISLLGEVVAWGTAHGVTLSPKTQSLLIAPALKWSQQLTLTYQSLEVRCLPPGSALRILGLYIDSMLSFEAHVQYLERLMVQDEHALSLRRTKFTIKALKVALRTRTVARAMFSMDTYYPRLSKRNKARLDSALSRCCKVILGTHSSSRNSANILECGIPFLQDLAHRVDTRRRLEAMAVPREHPFHAKLAPPTDTDARAVRMVPLHLPYNSAEVTTKNVSFHYRHNISTSAPEPLRRSSSLRLLSKTKEPSVEAWTDGSVLSAPRRAGGAVMIWRDELVDVLHVPAGPESSSFTAEHTALLACLRYLSIHSRHDDDIRIVTDSLSNVLMLEIGPLRQTTPEGMEAWEALMQLSRKVQSVSLVFVFGHCGLTRGDLVDEHAKQAAMTPGTAPPARLKDLVSQMKSSSGLDDAGFRSKYKLGPSTDTPDMPRDDLTLLYGLRTGVSVALGGVEAKASPQPCPLCHKPVLSRHGDVHPIDHLFECPNATHSDERVTPIDLWTRPHQAIRFVKRNLFGKN
eukprot:PhM_4_TR13984/c2_g1_i4/m.81642